MSERYQKLHWSQKPSAPAVALRVLLSDGFLVDQLSPRPYYQQILEYMR